MPQVTIYLDDETLKLVNAATKNTGISKSKWIADAVRLRVRKEWPSTLIAMAGAWPDFPTAEEIREKHGSDLSREDL